MVSNYINKTLHSCIISERMTVGYDLFCRPHPGGCSSTFSETLSPMCRHLHMIIMAKSISKPPISVHIVLCSFLNLLWLLVVHVKPLVLFLPGQKVSSPPTYQEKDFKTANKVANITYQGDQDRMHLGALKRRRPQKSLPWPLTICHKKFPLWPGLWRPRYQ